MIAHKHKYKAHKGRKSYICTCCGKEVWRKPRVTK